MRDLLSNHLADLLEQCARIPEGDPDNSHAETVRQTIVGLVEKMFHDLGYVLANPDRRGSIPQTRDEIVQAMEHVRASVPISRARTCVLTALRGILATTGAYHAVVCQDLSHTVLMELARAIPDAKKPEDEGRTAAELADLLGRSEQEISAALASLAVKELIETPPDLQGGNGEAGQRHFLTGDGFIAVEPEIQRENAQRQVI